MVFIGLPVALFFAWAFELTREGIQHERDVDRSQPVRPGKVRTLNVLIIGFLALVIAIMGIERFVSIDKSTPSNPSAGGRDSAISIAVLPFVNMSSDPEQEYFSDGITEEILNRLAKIKELQVTARTSVFFSKISRWALYSDNVTLNSIASNCAGDMPILARNCSWHGSSVIGLFEAST
jgi:hypothetical protein